MYTILAADIGGTHCRLAHFSADDAGTLVMRRAHTVDTAQVSHTAALLKAFSATGCDVTQADMLAVAVAGPLHNADEAQTTNASLVVNMAEARNLGARKTLLCNDFVAQAWACCSSAVEEAQVIFAGAAQGDIPLGPRSVLGAGTGLGTAWLVPLSQGGYVAMAAEAGHTAFPFVGSLEMSYQAFLNEKMQTLYPSADTVLSGRGLRLLHYFLTGKKSSAEEISAQYMEEEYPTCRWFATFLGRMCRHWALSTLCTGGLYITGGVAGKNPVLVRCAAFAQEFFSSPTHEHFLRRVPVLLNTHGDSGLWGAAWAGFRALQSAA